MRLVEFLVYLLEAQGHTLQRLAAIFGEDILFEILEIAGEKQESNPLPKISSQWFGKPREIGESHPYGELESAVREMKLPAVLEFHLWAYPHYRAFIESAADLNAWIEGPGTDTGAQMTEQAVAEAQAWVKQLPIPPEISQQTERAAQIPWIRFRTQVLKRIGKRPMGPVY